MSIPEIISELYLQLSHELSAIAVMRGDCAPRYCCEPRGKRLLSYLRGRSEAYADAALLLECETANPIDDLLKWRENDRVAYVSMRKARNEKREQMKEHKKNRKLPEFFIGRECVLTEVVTLLECGGQGSK